MDTLREFRYLNTTLRKGEMLFIVPLLVVLSFALYVIEVKDAFTSMISYSLLGVRALSFDLSVAGQMALIVTGIVCSLLFIYLLCEQHNIMGVRSALPLVLLAAMIVPYPQLLAISFDGVLMMLLMLTLIYTFMGAYHDPFPQRRAFVISFIVAFMGVIHPLLFGYFIAFFFVLVIEMMLSWRVIVAYLLGAASVLATLCFSFWFFEAPMPNMLFVFEKQVHFDPESLMGNNLSLCIELLIVVLLGLLASASYLLRRSSLKQATRRHILALITLFVASLIILPFGKSELYKLSYVLFPIVAVLLSHFFMNEMSAWKSNLLKGLLITSLCCYVWNVWLN